MDISRDHFGDSKMFYSRTPNSSCNAKLYKTLNETSYKFLSFLMYFQKYFEAIDELCYAR